jgi:hypothetical protein
MFSFLTIILELLGVVAKNPITQKVFLFSFFFGLVSFTVNFFILQVNLDSIISSVHILSLIQYLGFLNGLSVVFNFIITGFVVKQILAFVRG